MEGRRVGQGLLLTVLMLMLPLAGCTSAFNTVTPTARLSVDVDMIDVGEAVNFDDAIAVKQKGKAKKRFPDLFEMVEQ